MLALGGYIVAAFAVRATNTAQTFTRLRSHAWARTHIGSIA